LRNEKGKEHADDLKGDQMRTDRDQERLEKGEGEKKKFDKQLEARRDSPVDVPKKYDELRLNYGAEDYEGYFERSLEDVKKDDPETLFNDPKLVLQYRERVGIEHLSGRTFNPLV
jgi:hypothetical protein